MNGRTARAKLGGRRPAGLALAGLVLTSALLVAGARPAGAARSACPSSNKPNTLRIVSGSPQTAQLERAFQTNLQVQLANTNGCPLTSSLGGVSVTFSAPSSGASGTFASSGTSSVTVGTDANGVATAPVFTANDTSGSYSVRAESSAGSVRFSLANTSAGLAASIAAFGATAQEALVNAQYAQALQAQVLDADGHPVQGAMVQFQLGTGPYGASAAFVTGGGQASALTNASGLATSPPFVANGSPGRFTATASTTQLAAVATWGLDNHAATNTLNSPVATVQEATVGTRFARPLAARLLDPTGQPIEGAAVTFTLPQTAAGASAAFLGGSSQATVLTDATGQAISPPVIANASPGGFTATAAVVGITTPLSYALRNLPGRLVASNTARSAAVDRRYREPLTARVLDSRGRPVDGASVTFTLGKSTAGAGATFADGSSQATETTDAAGRAISPPVVANNVVGRFGATATMTGNTRPVAFSLSNVAGAPTAITAGAADGGATAAGSRFPVSLAVRVTDADGNPVAGTVVTFTAPAVGAGGLFHKHPGAGTRTVRVRTGEKGVAVAPPFVANAQRGGYVVTATMRGGRLRAAFALVNR